MPHTASPAVEDLHALHHLLAQHRYTDAEAHAAALAGYHQQSGALAMLTLAVQTAGDTATAADSAALANADALREATAAFTAERMIMLQAGGLEAVPWLHVVADEGAAPSPLGRFIEALLEQHGGLEAYLSALTPEQCQADAERCQAAAGSGASLAAQPLPLRHLGLVGLWFPRVPVMFCPREIAEQGLAAYLAAARMPGDEPPATALRHIGEQLAEAEQARQHWARVLPSPVYWVTPEELASTPDAVAKRLQGALPEAARPGQEAVKAAVLAACPAEDWIQQGRLARAFAAYVAPLREGYQEAMEALGLPAQSIEGFDWQLQSRLVAVDNAAKLPRQPNFTALMATNAFAMVAFDPAGRVTAESITEVNEFQHVPQALLGDGNPATLYATLDETLTAPLEPLPAEQLPKSLQRGAQVLTRLPINTLRLDDIEGLASLDWLILDELSNAEAVLENGLRTLKSTLLLQVGVAFAPTHRGQPEFTRLAQWAAKHGFAFYRLHEPRHRSLMPTRDDLRRPQATQLASADALFIPGPERLDRLTDEQRKRLAFVLDTVFGIHDLTYQLLAETDAALAERYLQARGYVGVSPGNDAEPLALFSAETPKRAAERGLAAMLAGHNPQRALSQAQRLLNDIPNDIEGRYYQGEALSMLGRHDQALSQLNALYQEAPTLRYGLALGQAQHRAGQNKAVRRTAEKLAEQHPAHPAVVRLGLLPVLGSHKRRELDEALARCRALLEHADSALVAAGLGEGEAICARAELLHIAACLEQALAKDAEGKSRAVAIHEQALAMLAHHQGPLRAQVLTGLARAQVEVEEHQSAIESLWQACTIVPRSLHTATAYAALREALGQSPRLEHQRLAELHGRVHQARIQAGKAAGLGHYGLPEDALAAALMPGARSDSVRREHYALGEVLPDNATALHVDCREGGLLLALADVLSEGLGLEPRAACVEVGNAVAEHLNCPHIRLQRGSLAELVTASQFDLVIACGTEPCFGVPEEDVGEALASRCKPGGLLLLESAGISQPQRTELGFADRATAIASAGFSVLRKGSLCDDGINYREFWLLKRDAEQPAVPLPKAGTAAKARLPIIEGDAAVTEPMHAICRVLAEEGAWFNPDLRIHAEGGNLSLYGTPGAARASYMRVPMAMMPQIDCFDLAAQDNRLVATPNGTPLLPRQHEMMEAMLELYNATDKLNLWQQSLPFLAWQQTPQVLEYLLKARWNPKWVRYQKLLAGGDQGTLLTDSFLGSRTFTITDRHLKALGVETSDKQRSVLLPLIDCLNHNFQAETFYTRMNGNNTFMRTFHMPTPDTGELFVRYNYYDAVDTTLTYGFMDVSSPWLASAPVTLDVMGQQIKVQGVPMQFSSKLPKGLEDLRTYMPLMYRHSDKLTTVTKLMLCTENPHSLRRVLTYLVYELGIAHTDFVARQQVDELERQLIEQNRQWWQGLSELTAGLASDHPARQLAEHSQGLIEQVAGMLGH